MLYTTRIYNRNILDSENECGILYTTIYSLKHLIYFYNVNTNYKR